MKLLKKIFYAFAAFLALIIFLIFISTLVPNFSESLGNLLYSKSNSEDTQATATDISSNGEAGNTDTNGSSATETSAGIVVVIPENQKYIAPVESELILPSNVAGKNGYEPVIESTEEIQEEEAQSLEQTLGVGETGEGLVFDATFYPYYAMLDDSLQSLYRQIYANALVLNDSFAPVETVSLSGLKNVFMAVIGDHPELFWMDTAYGCKYYSADNCVEIDLQFNSTATNLAESKQLFESSANKIIEVAVNLSSDYDKEVYVHNALISQVEYNLSAPLNQSAYSALVSGQTVCAGYARAFQYIMEKLGVPCYYCTGFAGENHAWNIISLDDGYYNVDTTWDDTDPNTYDYFNKSDSDFSSNHMRKDLSIYLPACNGEAYKNLEEEVTTDTADAGTVGTVEAGALEPVSDNGRTLQDVGFTEADVLNTITDYYNDCYNQAIANGVGEYQFQNVISLENVYPVFYDDYVNNNYNAGYLNKVVDELGLNILSYEIRFEELQNGYVLLTHKMSAK